MALDALAGFLNAVGTHFGEAPTAYRAVTLHGGGPSALMAMLRTAEGQTSSSIAGKMPGEQSTR